MTKIDVFEIEEYFNVNKIPQYVLLSGGDIFSHEYGIEILFSKYNISFPEMNINLYDGAPEPNEFINALETLPFISSERLIWIKNADMIFGKAKKDGDDTKVDKNKAVNIKERNPFDVLIDKNFPESNFLLLSVHEKIKSTSKLYKYILNNGAIINCDALNEYQGTEIIKRQAEKNGLIINYPEAKFLFDNCGGDMKMIMSELNKLTCVCTGKIERRDIERYVQLNVEQNVFRIHDLLCCGRYREAIRILKDILTEEAPIGIISLLGNNIRRMLIARACIDCNLSENITINHIIQETDSKEWAAKKAIKNCKKYSKSNLRYALRKLSDADYKLKQGIPVDVEALLIDIYSNK